LELSGRIPEADVLNVEWALRGRCDQILNVEWALPGKRDQILPSRFLPGKENFLLEISLYTVRYLLRLWTCREYMQSIFARYPYFANTCQRIIARYERSALILISMPELPRKPQTLDSLFMPLPPLRLIPPLFAGIVLPNALTHVVYKNMEIAGVPPALSRYQVT
jgi:hypothetical protein